MGTSHAILILIYLIKCPCGLSYVGETTPKNKKIKKIKNYSRMEFPNICSLSETRSTDACALYTIQSVYTLQICTTSKPFAYASHQLLIQLSLVPSAIMLMTLRNVTWTHRGRFLKYLNHLSRQNGTLATAQTSGPIRYVHLLFSGRLLPRFFLPPSLPHLLYLLTCLYTFLVFDTFTDQ